MYLQVAHVTHLLSLLYRANEQAGLISYTEFYNGYGRRHTRSECMWVCVSTELHA